MIKNVVFYVSPLEQFEVHTLLSLRIFEHLDVSFTNATLYGILASIIGFYMFSKSIKNSFYIPKRCQLISEFTYKFIIDMIKQQAGTEAYKFFPLIFTTFVFILFSNLVGLIPLGFTPTAHISLTFAIAFSFNLAWLFVGFFKNGISFLKLFVPSGAPAILVPLIVLIEVISYCLRTFSLSIRLFANMMAGHTLLHILASFVLMFINSGLIIFTVIPFVLILAVYVLELGIAFLQAYVFTILVCIYLNDSLHPGH
jgi:ATP synthase subunit 6